MGPSTEQNLMNSARNTTLFMKTPAHITLRAMVLVNLQSMKFLLEKVGEDFNKFSSSLLEFRNTPNLSGKSPAQMFFGRRLRGKLPHLPGANDLEISNAKAGADNRKELMEQRETSSGTTLKPLSINQRVLVQNPISKSWDETGTVTGIRPLGRSYDILMDSGKTFLRNRSFLRPIIGATKDHPTDATSTALDAPHPPQLRRSARISGKKVDVKATYSQGGSCKDVKLQH